MKALAARPVLCATCKFCQYAAPRASVSVASLVLRVRSYVQMFAFMHVSRKMLVTGLLFLAVVPLIQAQGGQDLDNYRWRVEGNWWFSSPTGSFGLQGSNSYFNINKDFGFGSYSTFTGKIDWRFGRKHHFLFSIAPVNNTRTVTIDRTIDFQG